MAIPNTAITRGEQYLAAMAGQSGTLPDEPITRKEHYLAKAAGQAVETPEPITREEMYLDAIAEGGGGGGGDISVVSLTATENKKYTAPSGTAYSPVTVNVPIPIPSLISKTVTENGTYAAADDGADGYASVTVDVQGSGGGEQTISFLDWVQQGCNTAGTFTTVTTRLACKHMLFRCKSISIPSGVQLALGVASLPTITKKIDSSDSIFLGFWSGTTYETLFTWFDAPKFDLTQIHNWSDNYVIMFLRHQDNSAIQPSEGNSVVVTYDFADGAFVR